MGLANCRMFMDMLSNHHEAQARPLQDSQICFKVGETPPEPLTKHLEQQASLTTLTHQNIATPDPMLQGNRRHARHVLKTQAQTYVSSKLSNPPVLQRVGTTTEERTRPCIWS